ncbi:hypothetical protein [Xanthomonas oryzae]|nr:hypothetical protein [Xanthomonas oryzae]
MQKAKRATIEVAPRFHAINAPYQAMIASPKWMRTRQQSLILLLALGRRT